MNGTIKKLTRDKGFGFVRADSGTEYFFHRSGVIGAGGFDVLDEGDKVRFEEEQSPKGPRAMNVERI